MEEILTKNRTLPLYESYISRITNRISSFSEAELRIAQYILDNSIACSNMSITELAAASKSSAASVVRLCKALGYSGFSELKFQIQQGGTTFQKDDFVVNSWDNMSEVKQKVAQFTQLSIHTLLQSLNAEALEQAVDILTHAPRIMTLGIGAASGVALSAAHNFLNMGLNAMYVSDELLQLRVSSQLLPEDAIVCLSYDSQFRSIFDIFKIARENAVSTILITSFPDSPTAQYADIVLQTSFRNNRNSLNFSTTMICQTLIIQLLMVGIWQRSGDQLLEKSDKMRSYTNLKRYDTKSGRLDGR